MEEKSREWRKGLFICRDNLVRKVWIKGLAAKHLHLVFIWCVGFLLFCRRRNIRGLKDFRDICKIRVMYDIGECIKSNFSKSDIGVPVFGGSGRILTVVDMEDCNLILSDQTVKLFDDTVKVMDDIVTAVACVTGVEADAQFVAVNDTVIDLCEFFEAASDLRSFPAMVSSAMLQGVSAVSTSLSPLIICAIPASVPAPTWAPGCRINV